MNTKYCKQCKLFKDINEFSTYKSNGRERIQAYCKPCKKLVGQKYYQDNKQKYKQHHKNFIEKNPNYQNDYNSNNREYFRDYMKTRYQTNKNMKIISQLMNELKTNIIIKSNSMKEIIGCDINHLTKWLHFTKEYNINEDEKQVVIEHLISDNKDDIKKYMNWKNLRLMTKSQNSKKNKNITLEDKIRHQYLLHCFIHNKEPNIEIKNVY